MSCWAGHDKLIEQEGNGQVLLYIFPITVAHAVVLTTDDGESGCTGLGLGPELTRMPHIETSRTRNHIAVMIDSPLAAAKGRKPGAFSFFDSKIICVKQTKRLTPFLDFSTPFSTSLCLGTYFVLYVL